MTHTCCPTHTPPQTEEKSKGKVKFYRMLIWNEMEFGTGSHIWHCQQKLVSGPVIL